MKYRRAGTHRPVGECQAIWAAKSGVEIPVISDPLWLAADQCIVILGGGSAGISIADLIKRAMVEAGLSDAEAPQRFYIVGRHGLVTDATEGLESFPKAFVQDRQALTD